MKYDLSREFLNEGRKKKNEKYNTDTIFCTGKNDNGMCVCVCTRVRVYDRTGEWRACSGRGYKKRNRWE